MNILITTHQGNNAGATYSIAYLAVGFKNAGQQVVVIAPGGTLLQQMLKNTGVSYLPQPISSYLDFKFVAALRQVVSDYQIDIIHAQSGKDRNLVILAKWLFGLKAKVVFTRRQRPRDEPWIKRWFHLQGSDGIVMVSHGLKRIFVKKGYPATRLMVIHNGINPDEIPTPSLGHVQDLRISYGLDTEHFVIGCIARKKRQLDLVYALPYLPNHVRLLLVGIHASDLERPPDDPRIIFTGLLERNKALSHMALMDAFVLPSELDGFGLSLVEAMMAGLPVIGSDFGGIRDIIQESNTGWLYKNGQSKMLANKINFILDHPDTANQVGQAGRKYVLEHFHVRQTIERYLDYFITLLEGKGSP